MQRLEGFKTFCNKEEYAGYERTLRAELDRILRYYLNTFEKHQVITSSISDLVLKETPKMRLFTFFNLLHKCDNLYRITLHLDKEDEIPEHRLKWARTSFIRGLTDLSAHFLDGDIYSLLWANIEAD